MKSVGASEARKHWFSLLDLASRGEVITIQRNGKELVLKLKTAQKARVPNYKKCLWGKNLDSADQWGWTWDDKNGLVSVIKPIKP
jgi:antitoxin (DNA-binding transcriptional repressor) of toxin-antitoxin stability system